METLKKVPRHRAIMGIIILFLWTKVGAPNLLYVLQYLDCIIKLLFLKKRIPFAASTAVYKTRVHIYDIDFWLHMNNAAYLRHAELARVDYFLRSNLRKQLKRNKFQIAFVAVNVRYRKELRLFKTYRIETRPLFWDQMQLIMEQRFIDPDTDFVHTIVYGKYVLVRNGKKVKEFMNGVVKDGLYSVQFYEHPMVSHGQRMVSNSSTDPLQPIDGIPVDKSGDSEEVEEDEECKDYDNVYQCRNEIPKSLRLWMHSLQQSSNESRMNLVTLS